MAKKTPNFGDLPFVQLTTTCTTVNIIESAVDKSLLRLSLLCWVVPVVARWRCELAKPRFLLFGLEFAPVVLRFIFHVIKNRELFSLSSPSSSPTRRAENYTHATTSAWT
jgi:hypothetical protein